MTTALIDFVGPRGAIDELYSDGAAELLAAAKECLVPHTTSTPGRPQTNGIAENAVKTVLQGTRTALTASGMPEEWWPYAAAHYCFAHNLRAVGDAPSPWVARFGRAANPKPKMIPFGARVQFLPTPGRGNPKKFAATAEDGLFLGYHLQPGGRWTGDYAVVALTDLLSDRTRLHPHRIKEVATEAQWEFPMLQLKDRSLSRNVAETTIVEEPDGRQPSAALPRPQAPVSGTLPRPEIGGAGRGCRVRNRAQSFRDRSRSRSRIRP